MVACGTFPYLLLAETFSPPEAGGLSPTPSGFNGTGFRVDDAGAGGISGSDQGLAIGLDSLGKVIVSGFSDRTVSNRDMVVWMMATLSRHPPPLDVSDVEYHSSTFAVADVEDFYQKRRF